MIRHRDVFFVAGPYTLSMATTFVVQVVDSTMVAPLGATALAALAITGTSSFLPNAVTMGLITSVQKRVATAGDGEQADRALSSGLVLGALIALPFAVIYFLFAREIAALFATGKAGELAASFLRITSFSFMFASMNQALNGYWIGSFKSGMRLAITLVVMAVNIAGNFLLIPRLGFSGVAISSSFAICSGFLLNMVLTRRLKGFRWRLPHLAEMLADAGTVLGVSLNQVSLALSLNAAVFIIGTIGVDALAVANVIGTLSLPALYLGIGYGTATGTYLAKCLSNKDLCGARVVANKGLSQVFVVSMALALGLVLWSEPIRHWFFVDPNPYELSRTPFLILAFLYIVDSFCCTLQRYHFLTGGLTFNLVTMTVVQLFLFIPAVWAGVRYLGMTYPLYLGCHLGQRVLVTAILYKRMKRVLESQGPIGPKLNLSETAEVSKDR